MLLVCPFIVSMLLLTELVSGHHWLRDTWPPTAVLVLCCDSEDVFLPFDEFGDRTARALYGGGDSNPADFLILVVHLLQDVVQDLRAAIVLRRLPVTGD